MGLLGGLMGNASEVEVPEVQEDFAQVLSSGERIEKAYRLIRDLFVLRTSGSSWWTGRGSQATRWSTIPCRTGA